MVASWPKRIITTSPGNILTIENTNRCTNQRTKIAKSNLCKMYCDIQVTVGYVDRSLWQAICEANTTLDTRPHRIPINATTFRLQGIALTVAVGRINVFTESTKVILIRVWMVNLFGKFVKRT